MSYINYIHIAYILEAAEAMREEKQLLNDFP